MTILMDDPENGFTRSGDKEAWLIEKGMDSEKLAAILAEATKLRGEGKQILTVTMAKNKKFQKDGLAANGYDQIKEFFNN